MKLSAHAQRRRTPVPWANWRATAHHGLPLELYSAHRQQQAVAAAKRIGRIDRQRCRSSNACGEPHGRQNLDVYRQLVEARSPA